MKTIKEINGIKFNLRCNDLCKAVRKELEYKTIEKTTDNNYKIEYLEDGLVMGLWSNNIKVL